MAIHAVCSPYEAEGVIREWLGGASASAQSRIALRSIRATRRIKRAQAWAYLTALSRFTPATKRARVSDSTPRGIVLSIS